MADRNVRIVKNAGRPVSRKLKKTASQAFDKNSLVEFASGLINPADDNDTLVYGIITEEVATSDEDYATTAAKDVDLIKPGDLVEIAYTGSAPTVGVSYGISNAYTVDTGDTTNDVFTVETVNSAAGTCRGYFKAITGGNTV